MLDRLFTEPQLTAVTIGLVFKSALVLATALLIVAALRRASAAIRSMVLSLALTATLILPLFMVLIPGWRLPVAGEISSAIQANVPRVIGVGIRVVSSGSAEVSPVSIVTIIMAIWLAGVSVLMSRLLLGGLLISRVRRSSTEVDDERAVDLTNRIAVRIGLRRSVLVAWSHRVSSPVATGVRRHTIILPEYARQWSMKTLEMALTHELAHVKRRDVMWNVVGSLAAALYWFNPLVWVCRRKMILETEKACDDCVVLTGTDSLGYAETLLGIARQVSNGWLIVPVGVHMTKKSELEGRLMAIMSERTRRAGVRAGALAAVVLLTVALVLPLSGLQMQNVRADEKLPAWDEFVKVDSVAQMIYQEKPVYPSEALDKKIQGTAYVHALVDKNGVVRDVGVSRTSGNQMLDQAAVDAARKCKYKPAVRDDKPVAMWVTYTVSFQLSDDDKSEK